MSVELNEVNLIRALNIYFKYVNIKLSVDDLFDYYFNDVQYVSNRSCNVMSNEEYKFLIDIQCAIRKLGS